MIATIATGHVPYALTAALTTLSWAGLGETLASVFRETPALQPGLPADPTTQTPAASQLHDLRPRRAPAAPEVLDSASTPLARTLQQERETLATLRRSIQQLFAQTPFETGHPHPAEALLARVWQEPQVAARRIGHLLGDASWRGRADLLRCLGHVPAAGGPGLRWVRNALRSADPDLREAALYALEWWNTPAGWRLLATHRDPDPYLARYVEQLLDQG